MEPSSTVSFLDVDNVTVENSEEKQAMLSYDKYRKGYLSMTDTDDQDKDKAHHGPCRGDRDDMDEDDDDEVTTQSETLFMDDDEHQATMLKLYYPKHLAHSKPKYKYNYSKTDKSISPDLLRMSDSTAVPPSTSEVADKPTVPRLCDQPSASLNVRPHIVDNVSESRTSFNFNQIAIPESTTAHTHHHNRKFKLDAYVKTHAEVEDEEEEEEEAEHDTHSASDKFVTGFIADDHTTQNTNTITVTNTHTTNTNTNTAELDLIEPQPQHSKHHKSSKKRSKKHAHPQQAPPPPPLQQSSVKAQSKKQKHKKKHKKRRKTATGIDDDHATNANTNKSKPSVTISISRTNSQGSSSLQSLRQPANEDDEDGDKHARMPRSVSDRGDEEEDHAHEHEDNEEEEEQEDSDAPRPVPIIRRDRTNNKHRRTATHSVIGHFSHGHGQHHHEAIGAAAAVEPRGLSISISESDQQSEDRSAPPPPPQSSGYGGRDTFSRSQRYFHSSKYDKVGANLIPQPRASQIEKNTGSNINCMQHTASVHTPTTSKRLALSSSFEFGEEEDGSRTPVKKMPYVRHNSDKVHTRTRARDVSRDVYSANRSSDDDDDYYDQPQELEHPRQSLHRTPHMARAKSQNSSSVSYLHSTKSRTERYIEADPPPIHSYNHCAVDGEDGQQDNMVTGGVYEDEDEDDGEDDEDDNYERMMAAKYASFLGARMSQMDMQHLEQVVDHFWHVMDIASNRKLPFEILKISLRVKSIVIREHHWDILLNELTNFQPSKNITVRMFKDFLFGSRHRRSKQHTRYGDEQIVDMLRRTLIVGLLETADHRHATTTTNGGSGSGGGKPTMSRSRSRAVSRPDTKLKSKATKNNHRSNHPHHHQKPKHKSKSKPTTLTTSDSYGYGEECLPIETVRFATVASPIATETSSHPSANSRKTTKTKTTKKTKTKSKSKSKSNSKPNPNTKTTTNLNVLPLRSSRQHQRSVSGVHHDTVAAVNHMEAMDEFGGREFSQLIQDIDRKRKRVHHHQQQHAEYGAADNSYPFLQDSKMRPRESYGGRMRSSSHHSYLQSSSLSTADSTAEFAHAYAQPPSQHKPPAPTPTLSSKHSNASSSKSSKSNRSLQSNQSYLRFSLQHSVISSLLNCYDNSMLKISGSRLMSYLNHHEWRKAIKYLLRCHFAYITDDHNMFSVEQFKCALYEQCDIQYKFGNEILPIMTLSTTEQYTQYVITEHSYTDWMLKYIDQMVQLRQHQSFKDEEIEKLLTIVCYTEHPSSRFHHQTQPLQQQHRPKPPQRKKTFENSFLAIGTAATPRHLNSTKSNDAHLKLSKAKSVSQVQYAAPEPMYMESSFPNAVYLRPIDSNQSNVSGHRQNYSTSQIAYKPPPPRKYMYHHYK